MYKFIISGKRKCSILSAAIILSLFLSSSLFAEYKVVILKSSSLTQYNEAAVSFANSLTQKSGFVVTEEDLAGDVTKKGKEIAKKINSAKPDLIYAIGEKAAFIAANYTENIPIIFSMVLNYKKKEFKLYNNPRVTGISLEVPIEITFMQMQMLVPNCKKIGLLYSDKSTEIIEGIKQKQKELGVELVEKKINDSDDVESAFDKIKKSKIEAVYMVADPIVYTTETTKYIIKECKKSNIPFIAYSDAFVKAGALLSVSPSYSTIGSQAATVAENIIIDKASPAELGVVSPIGTFFVINAETSKEIGLKVSEDVFGLADKVYKDESENSSKDEK